MNVALFRFVNDTLKNPVLDRLLPLFSDKDYAAIPGIVVLVALSCFGGRHARTAVLAILLALLCADRGSEKLLKNVFQGKRPYAVLEGVHLHRSGEWIEYDPAWYPYDERKSNGFPSSHAANAAALVLTLAFLRRRTLWGTVPLALLVGLSRIYTGNHFPLDVLGGYLWGGACGYAAIKLSPWLVRRIAGPEEEPAAAHPMPADRKVFLWVLGLWTLVNFVFIRLNWFELVGDEAQYWDWSRRLALGYYSKPPLIAYLNAVLVGAGGNHEWAIRSGAVLCASGTLALVYALTLRVTGRERAALLAAILSLAMPLSWAGSVLMTIDAPLAFFWALALYAFHRAVDGEKGMWWLTGFAMGFAMLSKYTVLLLLVSFVAYLVLVDRAPLRTRGPYLALLVMLGCMSGVLYWNWAHDWVSVRHTAAIGAGGQQSVGKAVGRFAEYCGAQAAVVSPVLFGVFIWAQAKCARRFRGDRNAAYLFLCFIVLFGFYALVAFTRPPQTNWPVCAYLAAAPAAAWVWSERSCGRFSRTVLAVGVLLGCLVGMAPRASGLLYVAARPGEREDRICLAGFAIDPDKDPTNRLRGSRELGAALSKYIAQTAPPPFLFSNRYQVTALMAFYTPHHPRTYCMNAGDRRFNQYDLWGGWDTLVGRDGLFVTGGDAVKAQAYVDGMVGIGAFESGEVLEVVEVRRGPVLIKTFSISRLHAYSGFDWTPKEAKY